MRRQALQAGGGQPSARLIPKHTRTPRGLVPPAIIYLVIITQLPFIFTVLNSLRLWQLLRPELGQKFVGLRNYYLLVTDPFVISTIIRTLVYTFSVVILSLLLGLVIAFLLHRSFPGRGIARTMLLTPMLIMPAASALVWKNMILHPVYGIFPWLMKALDLPSIDMLSQYPLAAVIIISVWQWYPFMMLISLAGLASIEQEQLESAQIDGANWWQSTRYIILPHLSSYLNVAILLGSIFILPTFDTLFIATAGGPGYATTNLAYAVYKFAFANFDIGKSSALGIINAIFTIIIATYLIRLTGKFLIRSEVLK
jgi:sorbitol/mannitol transport system permease protein